MSAPGRSLPSPRPVKSHVLAFRSRFRVAPPGLAEAIMSGISQIRTLSVERIGRRLARASEEEVDRVVEGLNEIIG